MEMALNEARLAAQRGEVPVGAVLVRKGIVISTAGNRTLEQHDPSAHAELLVIRDGCRQSESQRLPDCDLYVTLEPCALCAAAISFARIRRLYFAADDAKSGAVHHGPQFFSQKTCHHAPEIYSGIHHQAASALLKDFFAERRKPKS